MGLRSLFHCLFIHVRRAQRTLAGLQTNDGLQRAVRLLLHVTKCVPVADEGAAGEKSERELMAEAMWPLGFHHSVICPTLSMAVQRSSPSNQWMQTAQCKCISSQGDSHADTLHLPSPVKGAQAISEARAASAPRIASNFLERLKSLLSKLLPIFSSYKHPPLHQFARIHPFFLVACVFPSPPPPHIHNHVLVKIITSCKSLRASASIDRLLT